MSACARLSMPAMALLDTDGVYGAPRFHMAAKKLGVKAHIGAEVRANLAPQRHRGTEKNLHFSSFVFSVSEPALSAAEGCLCGESLSFAG